jgi:YesN/AraC family two-component response regulator
MLNEKDIMINIGMSKKYLHSNLLNHLSSSSMLSTFFINAMNEKTQSLKYIHFKSENSRRLPIFINEFLCEFYDPSINSTDILANLLGLIVAELINIFEQSMKKDISKKKKMSVVPIIHYIEENFQICTLKSVSKEFGLNPVYLSSLLKKNFGMNYKEIIQNKKLTYASKLLKNTEMPVTDIANEIGYENINFFYKKFKTMYGCTPGEFRNKL